MKFSNTRSKQLTEEEREQYREWGRQGGKKLAEQYGSEHMSNIGRAGAEAAKDTERPQREPRLKIKHRDKPAAPVQPDNLGDFI